MHHVLRHTLKYYSFHASRIASYSKVLSKLLNKDVYNIEWKLRRKQPALCNNFVRQKRKLGATFGNGDTTFGIKRNFAVSAVLMK